MLNLLLLIFFLPTKLNFSYNLTAVVNTIAVRGMIQVKNGNEIKGRTDIWTNRDLRTVTATGLVTIISANGSLTSKIVVSFLGLLGVYMQRLIASGRSQPYFCRIVEEEKVGTKTENGSWSDAIGLLERGVTANKIQKICSFLICTVKIPE